MPESDHQSRVNLRTSNILLTISLGTTVGLFTTSAATSEIAAHFADQPANALIHRLKSAQRHSWNPELGAVRIQATEPTANSSNHVELTIHPTSSGNASGFSLLKWSNAEWYGSKFWTGPDWTRIGKDWHHPGKETPSVRRFLVPRDGTTTISGHARKLHLAGDGVGLRILHGPREVWSTEIDGADATGVDPGLTLAVKKGDAIRFIVDKRGGISCDTTFWDPVIAYADGETHQASANFASTQGHGGWFYEMPSPPAAPPTLHLLRNDLSLRSVPIVMGQQLTVTDADALPCFIIADADNKSGAALVADATDDWGLSASLDDDGRLTLRCEIAPDSNAPPTPLLLKAFEGAWTGGFALYAKIAKASGPTSPAPNLGAQLRRIHQALVAPLKRKPELDLLLMAQAEWRRDDHIEETADSYTAAITDHLSRARELLQKLRRESDSASLGKDEARLQQLAADFAGGAPSITDLRTLYLRTRLLKRDILWQHPLLNFERLLFCKRRPPTYSHLVGQYFGWRQQPGGGLFVLEHPGVSLDTRDLIAGRLPPGNVLEPCLSHDARRIVFSFVACPEETPDSLTLPVNEEGPDEFYFHLHEIGVDGSGLRQLTRGPYDDLMPSILPDDGIAFCSTRRRGYSRCFGPNFSRRWHSYTLHRLDGDQIRILSANDVNEWFPTLSHSGEILFARWDYIDRDAVTHQNLWSARPDGTNPVAVWGNAAPKPHCVFQARPVPGSGKIAFIASAHHAVTGGPVCLLDPSVDANSLDAVKRITSGPFPESESRDIPDYYESPRPLSESLFLVAYSPEKLRFEGDQNRGEGNPDNALGLYVIDAAGNRELLYRDPRINCVSPIPLRPRPAPPSPKGSFDHRLADQGEMIVSDIYEGLGDIPRGTIKQVRVIQVFPKSTWLANQPRVGCAGEENTRAILGTAPVESDGSARFLVPALKPVLLQALDADGFAVQTMRSTTYVQPGEQVSCIGCHEDRAKAAPSPRPLIALQRPPSILDPGELGGRPFSYMEVVQPVLDRRCVSCHGTKRREGGFDLSGTPETGFVRSYRALCGNIADFTGTRTGPEVVAANWISRFGQRNQIQVTPPGGAYGALGSRLMKLLRAGHAEVKLTDDEFRRLAAWIDCNAVFYGDYDPNLQARQLAGEHIPFPERQ